MGISRKKIGSKIREFSLCSFLLQSLLLNYFTSASWPRLFSSFALRKVTIFAKNFHNSTFFLPGRRRLEERSSPYEGGTRHLPTPAEHPYPPPPPRNTWCGCCRGLSVRLPRRMPFLLIMIIADHSEKKTRASKLEVGARNTKKRHRPDRRLSTRPRIWKNAGPDRSQQDRSQQGRVTSKTRGRAGRKRHFREASRIPINPAVLRWLQRSP